MQSDNRSIFGELSRMWGREIDTDRALWDEWAKANPQPNGFGGTFQLDGNQAYMMLNHTAVRLGGWVAKKSQPPVATLPATVDTLSAVGGVPVGTIVCTTTKLGTGVATAYTEFHIAGQFQSPGRRSIESRFKYVADVAGNVDTYTITGLQSNVWYWVRARYVGLDGQVSNWVWDQALVN
jgi:hypothetical protein